MIRHHYLAIGLAGSLAACTGQPQLGGLPATGHAAERGGSWMAALSATQDLLYVTDVGTNDVYVYSYPQSSLVGTLTGFNAPVRVCSDPGGNVYITNTNSRQILKYAHGGSQAIATYRDPHFLPVDCSVDPSTGTLAVTNYGPTGSNTGSVAIYAGGKGRAKVLQDPNTQAYLFCAYDGSGNLFVDGLDATYDFVLLELPKGSAKFERIDLKEAFPAWGGVKWDGKYLAIGDGVSTIYDFSVAGKAAKKVRAIHLRKAVNVVQFWIDGSTVIAPDGPNGANHDAAFWSYPNGGAPTGTIGAGLFENPSGAAVSRGQSPGVRSLLSR